eukprot:TRINITY_DN85030_c0_g1_i1.p1 TRINITY_DN85030_c0_g1~~TRINITY_DN85030_c0_g1_i1.p1  ORF type:complete len:128 (+),score=23.85 TRINITY_DN85030_c0_g1_i1:83-466(+)
MALQRSRLLPALVLCLLAGAALRPAFVPPPQVTNVESAATLRGAMPLAAAVVAPLAAVAAKIDPNDVLDEELDPRLTRGTDFQNWMMQSQSDIVLIPLVLILSTATFTALGIWYTDNVQWGGKLGKK